MKAKNKIPQKGQMPDLRLKIEGPPAVSAEEKKLLERPLNVNDPPDDLPGITQTEMIEVLNAFRIFQLPRTVFEQKRAALTLKLLRYCDCEEGSYFASLDEHDNLIVEDHSSKDTVTGRPIVERVLVPSGGAA